MTTTATKTIQVNKTATEVEAHNTKPLVTNGLELPWEQSAAAKQAEAKEAAAAAKQSAFDAKMARFRATVEAINASAAASADLQPVSLLVDAYFAPGSSSWRTGPFAGVQVSFRYDEFRRIYRFNDKTGKLNEKTIERGLREFYSIRYAKLDREAADATAKLDREAKVAAAKQVLEPDLLARIAKVAKKTFSELTPRIEESGMISITYSIYYSTNSGGSRGRHPYEMNVAKPMNVSHWEQWVDLLERHAAELAAFNASLV